MDSRTGPNQFAPSTSSKLGAKQCINVQVMSLTNSIYDHFYHLTFKCDLDLQPTYTNVLNGTSPSQRQQLCKLCKWAGAHVYPRPVSPPYNSNSLEDIRQYH